MMRVCIIGASGHYGYVLDDIKRGCSAKIVGIAPGPGGEDITHLVRVLQTMPQGPAFNTFDCYCRMLDEVKPDIVVANCVFNEQSIVVQEVLRRGIHLFAEKPLATRLEDLEPIKAAYKSSKVHLAAMMGLRYARHFYTAHTLIRDGAVGEIRLLQAQKSYKLGNRPDYYKDRNTYGGTIPWVGSHAIDWVYWFSGRPFVSVFAAHSSMYNQGHGDLESSALCHFELEGGTFASVSLDYYRPSIAPSHDDDRIRVVGTEGILEVRGGLVYLTNHHGNCNQEMTLLERGGIFSDFAAQVAGSGKCLISGEESLYITEICLLARQSADTNSVIRCQG